MTKETLAFVTEKTKELTAAHSCCAELKETANNWLAAAGTDKEAEATKAYVAELEADIMPIDGLITFAESDMGAKIFGAEMAKNVAKTWAEFELLDDNSEVELKMTPAAAPKKNILAKKEELFK